MPTRRRTGADDSDQPSKRPLPATTPLAREQQLIALAFDVVEERLRNGQATSQETTHFLKLGSTREFLEQERLAGEVALNKAKIENMAHQSRMEDLMKDALDAMRSYKGERVRDDEGYTD